MFSIINFVGIVIETESNIGYIMSKLIIYRRFYKKLRKFISIVHQLVIAGSKKVRLKQRLYFIEIMVKS